MGSHKKFLKKSHSLATYDLPPQQAELKGRLESRGFNIIDPLAWTHGLSVRFSPEEALEGFRKLKEDSELGFDMLVEVTCVDYMDERDERFEVVYLLMNVRQKYRLCVKISVDEDSAKVPSVVGFWKSANFLEREVYDMFGVQFEGHPDLRRILMYDEFVGYPLRKDYPVRGKQPRVQLRIPELRNTSADLRKEELVSLPVRRGTNG